MKLKNLLVTMAQALMENPSIVPFQDIKGNDLERAAEEWDELDPETRQLALRVFPQIALPILERRTREEQGNPYAVALHSICESTINGKGEFFPFSAQAFKKIAQNFTALPLKIQELTLAAFPFMAVARLAQLPL